MYLSIIIPIYNSETYLRDCIDSCLEQTADGSDYEIILVNDGSTDASAAIVSEYAQHRNLVFIDRDRNRGIGYSRNEAIAAAKGEYLWFVDSDDFIAKSAVADIIHVIRQQAPENIHIGVYRFYMDNVPTQERSYFYGMAPKANLAPVSALSCSNIWNAAFLKDNRIRYREELRRAEDAMLYYEAMKLPHKSAVIEKVCYYYRFRNHSPSPETALKNQTETIRARVLKANIERDYFDRETPPSHATVAEMLGDSKCIFSAMAEAENEEIPKMVARIDYKRILPYQNVFKTNSAKAFLSALYADVLVFNYRAVYAGCRRHNRAPLQIWKQAHDMLNNKTVKRHIKTIKRNSSDISCF